MQVCVKGIKRTTINILEQFPRLACGYCCYFFVSTFLLFKKSYEHDQELFA